MKKLALSIMTICALFANAFELTDQYQRSNMDGSMTYAVSIEGLEEGDQLTIYRNGQYIECVVADNIYNPNELGECDTLDIVDGVVRFADTFAFEFDEFGNRFVQYYFEVNYERFATIEVNFGEADTMTSLDELQASEKENIYYITDRIFVRNGKKYLKR